MKLQPSSWQYLHKTLYRASYQSNLSLHGKSSTFHYSRRMVIKSNERTEKKWERDYKTFQSPRSWRPCNISFAYSVQPLKSPRAFVDWHTRIAKLSKIGRTNDNGVNSYTWRYQNTSFPAMTFPLFALEKSPCPIAKPAYMQSHLILLIRCSKLPMVLLCWC